MQTLKLENLEKTRFTEDELQYFKENIDYNILTDLSSCNEIILIGNDFEISVEKYKNKYNVTWYKAVVEIWDLDNEIVTSESLAQHGIYPDPEQIKEELDGTWLEECRELLDKDPSLESIETRECLEDVFTRYLEYWAEREIERWQKVPSLKGHYMSTEVEIERIVKEVECPINIPHFHLYRGYRITIVSQSKEELVNIINMVELLVSLYENTLSLNKPSEGE